MGGRERGTEGGRRKKQKKKRRGNKREERKKRRKHTLQGLVFRGRLMIKARNNQGKFDGIAGLGVDCEVG